MGLRINKLNNQYIFGFCNELVMFQCLKLSFLTSLQNTSHVQQNYSLKWSKLIWKEVCACLSMCFSESIFRPVLLSNHLQINLLQETLVDYCYEPNFTLEWVALLSQIEVCQLRWQWLSEFVYSVSLLCFYICLFVLWIGAWHVCGGQRTSCRSRMILLPCSWLPSNSSHQA